MPIPWNKNTKGVMKPNSGSFKPRPSSIPKCVCKTCEKIFQPHQRGKANKFCSKKCQFIAPCNLQPKYGPENNAWRGGITRIQDKIRQLPEYKLWRQTIFIRDDYTCQNQSCGLRGGDKHVDHIKQFALILQENKITTIEQALQCSQLWDINNGRTLCVPCHKQTDTYLKKLIIVT